MKHSELPKELQAKQTPYEFYLKDTLEQVGLAGWARGCGWVGSGCLVGHAHCCAVAHGSGVGRHTRV